MAAATYPSSLPGPTVSGTTPAERRLLSDLPGERQNRGLQRDYLATQQLEWMFTASEAEVFDRWWRNDLDLGGAWFTSKWPSPKGWVDLVRAFVTAPAWSYVNVGVWRVSAEVQVRGLGLPPQDCEVENFVHGLGSWSLDGGSFAPYSVVSTVGGNLLTAANTDNPGDNNSYIGRALSARTVSSFGATFRLNTLEDDDGLQMQCTNGGVEKILFIPRRETVFDPLNRARVYVDGLSMQASTGALSTGIWYSISFTIVPGVGNSTLLLTTTDDGAVVYSANPANDIAPVPVDRMRFLVDSATSLSETQYSNVHLC